MSEETIQQLVQLAYIDADTHLAKDIQRIMEFMQQLSSVNTEELAPLFHPFNEMQRFRQDRVHEKNRKAELASIAPLFDEDFYLVPKVIDSGQ